MITSATFKKDKLNISDDVMHFDYPHFSSPELSVESAETSITIKNFISTLNENFKNTLYFARV